MVCPVNLVLALGQDLAGGLVEGEFELAQEQVRFGRVASGAGAPFGVVDVLGVAGLGRRASRACPWASQVRV